MLSKETLELCIEELEWKRKAIIRVAAPEPYGKSNPDLARVEHALYELKSNLEEIKEEKSDRRNRKQKK